MEKDNDKLQSALHTPVEAQNSEDEESIWLISYADLMTLMFTFFVMLYASLLNSNNDSLRKALSGFVQGNGKGSEATSFYAAEEIKKSLSARIEQEQLINDVQIALGAAGLKITFSSNLLFDLGVAELRPDSKKTLLKMAEIIKDKGANLKIRIEGHTDDNPIKSGRFKSNWELSGARAAHIASLFEQIGIPAKNLLAIGYGESRPLANNRTPSGTADIDGQRLNRRVVVTLYEETSEAREEPK